MGTLPAMQRSKRLGSWRCERKCSLPLPCSLGIVREDDIVVHRPFSLAEGLRESGADQGS